MNDDNYSGDLHAWIEPEIEARVVALILGEASDFEAEELERLMEERPEIRVFKRRLESVHGLLGVTLAPGDDEEWRLPPEKRVKLLEALELTPPADTVVALEPAGDHPTKERRIRRAGRRVIWSAAACLTLTVVIFALLVRNSFNNREATFLSFGPMEGDVDRKSGPRSAGEESATGYFGLQSSAEKGALTWALPSEPEEGRSYDVSVAPSSRPEGLVREQLSKLSETLSAPVTNHSKQITEELRYSVEQKEPAGDPATVPNFYSESGLDEKQLVDKEESSVKEAPPAEVAGESAIDSLALTLPPGTARPASKKENATVENGVQPQSRARFTEEFAKRPTPDLQPPPSPAPDPFGASSGLVGGGGSGGGGGLGGGAPQKPMAESEPVPGPEVANVPTISVTGTLFRPDDDELVPASPPVNGPAAAEAPAANIELGGQINHLGKDESTVRPLDLRSGVDDEVVADQIASYSLAYRQQADQNGEMDKSGPEAKKGVHLGQSLANEEEGKRYGAAVDELRSKTKAVEDAKGAWYLGRQPGDDGIVSGGVPPATGDLDKERANGALGRAGSGPGEGQGQGEGLQLADLGEENRLGGQPRGGRASDEGFFGGGASGEGDASLAVRPGEQPGAPATDQPASVPGSVQIDGVASGVDVGGESPSLGGELFARERKLKLDDPALSFQRSTLDGGQAERDNQPAADGEKNDGLADKYFRDETRGDVNKFGELADRELSELKEATSDLSRGFSREAIIGQSSNPGPGRTTVDLGARLEERGRAASDEAEVPADGAAFYLPPVAATAVPARESRSRRGSERFGVDKVKGKEELNESGVAFSRDGNRVSSGPAADTPQLREEAKPANDRLGRLAGRVADGREREQELLAELSNTLQESEEAAGAVQLFDGQAGARELTEFKLKNIVVPRVEFEDVSVEEAVDFLRQRSRELDHFELDPAKRDVTYEWGYAGAGVDGGTPETDYRKARISGLSLENVPLEKALQSIAEQAQLKYSIDANGKVQLVPLNGPDGVPDSEIEVKTWEIPVAAWSRIVAGKATDASRVNAKDLLAVDDQNQFKVAPQKALEDYGITFPEGATVTYVASTGKLVAKNTAVNHGVIESLVQNSMEQVEKEREALAHFEKSAAAEPFSTFSLHVSDVSFKLAKAALDRGEWPAAGKIRVEEFVNAFDYGDPAPTQEEKVACQLEQAAHPFLQQRNLLRISMRTAALGRAAGTPLRLTVLLDNSGSMERVDRVESVQSAFTLLASQLQPQDQVTLISFARTPRLLADRVSGDQADKLAEMVGSIPSEGGTNLEEALRTGIAKAKEQLLEGGQNRIILLTDGAANLGNAKPEELSELVEGMRQQGIAFDACGVGAEGLNDEILESLTRKGDGRYYFLDRPEDADAGFAKQIAGALRPAARNVKIQVNFNPERVGHYKLYGFEKHLLKKEDFRNDSVDAAELAAEEAGNAIYQVEVLPEGEGEIGTVSVRFQDMDSGQMVEKLWTIPYDPGAPRLEEAPASLRLASGAALLGEKLKGSIVGEAVDMNQLGKLMNTLPADYPSNVRVKHLVEMTAKARELAPE